MASAVESPRPFSFRAPVSPALAQPQLALRLLAGWQVDHWPLALSLVRLALRPDRDRQAAWLEVYGRQVAHALFRLAPLQHLHHQVACQVGRSWVVVLALLRRDAHAHRDHPVAGVCRHAQFRKLYRALAVERLRGHQAAQVLGPGRTCFAAGHVQVAAAKLGKPAPCLLPALPPDWWLLRVEVDPRVRPVCLCPAQMVQAKHVPVALLVSVLLLVASFLRQEAFLLLREAHDPVCLLDRVKLLVPQLRREPLNSRQLLAADFRLRERQPGLAEERSWDSPS
jgi:hypothetical protein